MTLEYIPQIDDSVIQTHFNDRYRSHEEFERYKQNIGNYLMFENKGLGCLIDSLLEVSEDPESVLRTAYTLLDAINAQIEVNELNEMAGL